MSDEKIRIFVVDDEPGVLSTMKSIFENFDITTELNPIRAVERIKNEQFDICIVDYSMPGMNGIEVLRTIKEEYRSYYIGILCTAYGTIHLFKEEFNQALFSYFIEKPFEIDSLKDIMTRAISKLRRIKEGMF